MSIFLALLKGFRLGEALLFLSSVALQGRLLASSSRPALAPAPAAPTDEAEEPPKARASPARALTALPRRAAALSQRWVAASALGRALAGPLGRALASRALGGAVAVLAGAQAWLEGGRWQLAGLYAGSGVALAAEALLQPAAAGWRRAAGAASAALTSLTALATLAFPWFALPRPTGRYAVGRLSRVLVDPGRGAWVTEEKGSPRTLLVDVWYPADPSRHPRTPYMEQPLAAALAAAFLGPRFSFVASHFARVRSAARAGAPAAAPPHLAGFPLLVFSHGNVSTRVQNTGLLEELASHGWVCCAVDHPHDAACVVLPDGSTQEFEWELPGGLDAAGVLAFRARQVALRAGDVMLCLDALRDMSERPGGPLAGRVDVRRAAVMGHSFGGAAAAAAARSARFRAAVLLDAWQWPLGGAAAGVADGGAGGGGALPPGGALSLPCPALLFESDAFLGDRDAFCAFNGRMSSAMALASGPGCWKVVARVGHYEYTDMALSAPLLMRRIGLLALRPPELRAFQRHQARLVRSFLEAHVAGAEGEAEGWAPPPGRLCATCSREELLRHVVGEEWTARQRKAMRLLLLQVRRGDYECWAVGRELRGDALAAVLAQVIHTHDFDAIRRLMRQLAKELGEAVEEEEVEAAEAGTRGRRRSRSGERHRAGAVGAAVAAPLTG